MGCRKEQHLLEFHLLWKIKALALDEGRGTKKNHNQHFTSSVSIHVLIGGNCCWKEALLQGLLPGSGLTGLRGPATRKSKNQVKDKDNDKQLKPQGQQGCTRQE